MMPLAPIVALAAAAAAGGSAGAGAASAAAAVPSLNDLASLWVDPNAQVSAKADVVGADRDLATIQNFWGAVGIAPEGTRPVDMFAVNSLELPPFAGCGCGKDVPYGCGRMLVDGQQVVAAGTRWQVHEAGRRSAPLPGSGVVVESATRMPFEQNGVFWQLNFTNPGASAVTIRVDFTLSAMVNELSTVGTWVYPATNAISEFKVSPLAGGGPQKGVTSCGGGKNESKQMGSAIEARDACSRYVFVGDRQPDVISFPPAAPPPAPPHPCSIAGNWIQQSSGDTFGPFTEDSGSSPATFSWARDPLGAKAKTEGWYEINGTVTQPGNAVSFHYYHTKARGGAPTLERGSFGSDCNHVTVGDSAWHRPGTAPDAGGAGTSPAPNATFKALHIPAGQTFTLRIALSIGVDTAAAEATGKAFAADSSTFELSWAAAHDQWQKRWAQAFTPAPADEFWSGNLPTLALAGDSVPHSTAAGVSRVFYMSILTVVAQMRTNLPLIFKKVRNARATQRRGLSVCFVAFPCFPLPRFPCSSTASCCA